jgi:hypothetical protein
VSSEVGCTEFVPLYACPYERKVRQIPADKLIRRNKSKQSEQQPTVLGSLDNSLAYLSQVGGGKGWVGSDFGLWRRYFDAGARVFVAESLLVGVLVWLERWGLHIEEEDKKEEPARAVRKNDDMSRR